MAQPVAGAVVAIFGTESPTLGCTCEYHSVCGCCVDLDSLVRFKRATVGADDNTYRTIQGAFWVTEGADRCIVGRLAPELKEQQGNLEGRIAQVIEIFSRSASTSKIAYSNKHGGVCLAMLVDKAEPMDSFLNAYLPEVHSESDSDEN